MDPHRPPIPPRPTRISVSDAPPPNVPLNPLYNMHVSAAAGQRAYQRSNTSPSSFYPPHLAQHVHLARPSLAQPALAAPPLPVSLMPGGGPRKNSDISSSFENSLFFQTMPSLPVSAPPVLPKPSRPPAFSKHTHPYARAFPSVRGEPETSPVLPPKPPMRTQVSCPLPQEDKPQVPPKLFVPQESAPMMRTQSSQSPMSPADQDEVLARVLELSLQESGPAGSRESEDAILARVLKESMASINTTGASDSLSSRAWFSKTGNTVVPIPGSSSLPSGSSEFVGSSRDVSNNIEEQVRKDTDKEANGKHKLEAALLEEEKRRKQLKDDEKLARALERQENARTPSPPSRSPSLVPSKPEPTFENRPANISQTSSPTFAMNSTSSLPHSQSSNNLCSRPISYTISAPTVPQGRPLPSSDGSSSVTPTREGLGRSTSAQASFPSHPQNLPLIPNGTRPTPLEDHSSRSDSSCNAGELVPRSKQKFTLSEISKQIALHSAPQSVLSVVPVRSSSSSAQQTTPTSATNETEDDLQSPISPLEPGQGQGQLLSAAGPSSPVIEEELLLGVSFGFDAPSLSHHHEPMHGPIPNIITLPYSKAPPLHIQAPSWKQLLKLLTRLSESRIEPTVEALAGTKADLRLRTVVQFVKVHHQSSDWRTIVYLSIDVPVPPEVPNAFKYTNGDVSTFPYSYTTSPLPGILRTGAGDSSTSKCFTVPATVSTPFPKLPLALPDFAMYLHSILRDSRRAANDASGGLRKLAKMVESFYPQTSNPAGDVIGAEDEPERRGMGGLFRRALGRERRKHGQSSGNADTYEYITPFRIDEYR